MPLLNANQAPPLGYYARNLQCVIDTVFSQYEDVLTKEECEFVNASQRLSEQALRLLARLLSRTRTVIRAQSLAYADVPDISSALNELSANGLITLNEKIDEVEILSLLTVPELKTGFADCKTRGRKDEIIEAITETLTADEIYARLNEDHVWLNVIVGRTFELYCLLFFGNAAQRLDEFVIRDLGLTRFESYELDPQYRLFPDRRAINRHQELLDVSHAVHELGTSISPSIASVLFALLAGREHDRVTERHRSRILNALGRNLERLGEFQPAMKCYAQSTIHPARERTMRILKRIGDEEALEKARNDIMVSPFCLEETLFAGQFALKRKRQHMVPVRTDDAPSTIEQGIEAFAVEQLVGEGCQAWHIENLLPNGLFALAYWDWLFASVRGAFVNPFQFAPLDLYWPDFFEKRRSFCLDPLSEVGDLKAKMIEVASRKRGVSCQLIAWQVFSDELLSTILEAMGAEQLRRLLAIMTEDMRQFRAGFPDLTVVDAQGNLQFIEVKGPGDQLRPNQRLWLERLTKAQFDVYLWRFK